MMDPVLQPLVDAKLLVPKDVGQPLPPNLGDELTDLASMLNVDLDALEKERLARAQKFFGDHRNILDDDFEDLED